MGCLMIFYFGVCHRNKKEPLGVNHFTQQLFCGTIEQMKNDGTTTEQTNPHGLPEAFRTLMWSYKFERVDPAEHRHEIIVNVINYGDLVHWRWIVAHYGLNSVRHELTTMPITEIRQHVRRLVSLLFGISEDEFKHASRGTH